MPDEVHCTSGSSHTFTCEVLIGPDPDPAPAASSSAKAKDAPPPSTAQPEPHPARDPAVAALVQSYQQVSLRPPEVSYITGKALIACAGNELSILLAGVVKGPLAPMIALKVGYDAGKCLASERNAAGAVAAQKEVIDDCAARGGTVTSVIGDRAICEVPMSTKPR